MKKVGIVMGSDSDMPVMSKAAAILDKLGVEYEMKIISAHREPDVFFEYAKTCRRKRIQSNYCRSRNGSTSSGNVRSDLPDAGYRHSNAYNISGRTRFTVFNRTDAVRNPGSNSSNQWRRKRRTSGRKDSGNIMIRNFWTRLKAYSQELKEQVEAKDARLQKVGYKAY